MARTKKAVKKARTPKVVARRPAPAPSSTTTTTAPAPVFDTRADIAHLWRRAGFGATAAELDRLTPGGYAAAVEEVLDLTTFDEGTRRVLKPPLTSAYSVDKDRDMAARAQLMAERPLLATWWLERMTASTRPLQEKLPWFWHGHFATSVEKVEWADLMDRQNALFRASGSGTFESLVQAVAKDPAMLLWLDAGANHAKAPNENFARELMELFTVGVGSFGESDVREAARCFTGWRLDTGTLSYRLNPSDHDTGTKTVLGQNGRLNGEDVVHIACSHPASARFVTSRLWSRFARPAKPDDPVVVALAASFATTGSIAGLLRAIFLHPEFRSPATRVALAKSPVEWVVGAARALGQGPDNAMLTALTQLGQVPFAPPNVGGWPANEAWLGTNASLVRLTYGRYLAGKADLSLLGGSPQSRPEALARHLGIARWTGRTAAALVAAPTPAEAMTLALVAPEYLLN